MRKEPHASVVAAKLGLHESLSQFITQAPWVDGANAVRAYFAQETPSEVLAKIPGLSPAKTVLVEMDD